MGPRAFTFSHAYKVMEKCPSLSALPSVHPTTSRSMPFGGGWGSQFRAGLLDLGSAGPRILASLVSTAFIISKGIHDPKEGKSHSPWGMRSLRARLA